jgi:hypothetical protein
MAYQCHVEWKWFEVEVYTHRKQMHEQTKRKFWTQILLRVGM